VGVLLLSLLSILDHLLAARVGAGALSTRKRHQFSRNLFNRMLIKSMLCQRDQLHCTDRWTYEGKTDGP